jgi:hypothetical protein
MSSEAAMQPPEATDWSSDTHDGEVMLSVHKRLKADECGGRSTFYSSYPSSCNQLSDKQVSKTRESINMLPREAKTKVWREVATSSAPSALLGSTCSESTTLNGSMSVFTVIIFLIRLHTRLQM